MAREQLQTLTEPMYFILLALARRPAHGYEIMKTVTEISRERVKVGAGTLYALLTRFENEGIVLCVGNDGRRKTYTITGKGQDILKAEYLRLAESAAAYERHMKMREGLA
jgi:DNA-binding PadR family transcriptional regulator